MAPWILPTLVAVLAVSSACRGAARDANEVYLIVDADARQADVEGFPGALFRFDRASGESELFSADPRFVDPQLAIYHGDDLLVLDFSADPDGRGKTTGAVFQVSARTGEVVRHWSPAEFVSPNGMALGPDQVLYVTDRHARPGNAEGQGAVFALDLESGHCKTVATDARFVAPAFVLHRDDGSLLVLDADTPTDHPGEEGVLFTIDPGTGAVKEFGRLEKAVSPLALLAEPDGNFLVFDVNADPLEIGGPLGAVFRFHPETNSTELLASDMVFRDPVRGCFADDGLVLFVDANADPEKRGPDAAGRGQNITGGGAILSLDLTTNQVRVVAAPLDFVNPVAILRMR